MTRKPKTRGRDGFRPGPVWKWFQNVDMDRLSKMSARLGRMRSKGIMPLGGKYPEHLRRFYAANHCA